MFFPNNVIELIQRIATGQPGFTFLVGAKKIAMLVESQTDRKANARADGVSTLAVGPDHEDRASLTAQVIVSFTVLHAIGVGIIGATQAEEKVIVLVEGETQSIDAASGVAIILGPAGDHDFFGDLLVGSLAGERGSGRACFPCRLGRNLTLPSLALPVKRNLAVGDDVESFRPPCHGQRRPQSRFVPKNFGFIFQAITVRVTKEVNSTIVSKGK